MKRGFGRACGRRIHHAADLRRGGQFLMSQRGQFRMSLDSALGSNSRDRSSAVLPARTSSISWRRYSAGYLRPRFVIVATSSQEVRCPRNRGNSRYPCPSRAPPCDPSAFARASSVSPSRPGRAGASIPRCSSASFAAFQRPQLRLRRGVDPRLLRQPPQKLQVVLAAHPSHDAPHRRVRLQGRRVDAQRLPPKQPRLRKPLQYPAEHRLVRLQIDPPPRPRDRRMVRRCVRGRKEQERPQAPRIVRPPGDLPLRGERLEIPDQLQAEIAPRGQPPTAPDRRVEPGAPFLHELVELPLFQNPVQAPIEGMGLALGQVRRGDPNLSGLLPRCPSKRHAGNSINPAVTHPGARHRSPRSSRGHPSGFHSTRVPLPGVVRGLNAATPVRGRRSRTPDRIADAE